MIGLNIDSRDLRRAADFYERMAQREVPFATARALTWTAKEGAQAAAQEAKSAFDAPTPFTQKAFTIEAASKRKLAASVLAKDRQADYLGIQVTGGTRRPKKRVLVRPGPGLKVNKYGNIPRGRVKRLADKPDHFVGKAAGQSPAGIYKRPSKAKARRGEGPQLIIAFGKAFSYRPRLDFYGETSKVFVTRFPHLYRRSLEQAIESTKRRAQLR